MSKKPTYVPGDGNVQIILGDVELTLRPTLNAATGISRGAGGIRGAIDRCMNMDLDTITMVIRMGIGQDEAKRLKNLDRMVYENGLMDSQGEVLARCVEFLSNLARGGRSAASVGEDEDDDSAVKEGDGEDPSRRTQPRPN